MKCIKCGRPVGASRYCNACGFDNKHIAKALNTADYYYNIGLEKAQMHDLSGAEIYLKKALNYNKSHKNARNLLGLVYNEMGEGGKAYPMEDQRKAFFCRRERCESLHPSDGRTSGSV